MAVFTISSLLTLVSILLSDILLTLVDHALPLAGAVPQHAIDRELLAPRVAPFPPQYPGDGRAVGDPGSLCVALAADILANEIPYYLVYRGTVFPLGRVVLIASAWSAPARVAAHRLYPTAGGTRYFSPYPVSPEPH